MKMGRLFWGAQVGPLQCGRPSLGRRERGSVLVSSTNTNAAEHMAKLTTASLRPPATQATGPRRLPRLWMASASTTAAPWPPSKSSISPLAAPTAARQTRPPSISLARPERRQTPPRQGIGPNALAALPGAEARLTCSWPISFPACAPRSN